MTDKDSLIEVFKKIEYTPFPDMTMKSNLANQFTEYALNCIVDGLITNGAIVQPCDIYDDVYLIVNGIVERCTVEGIHYTRKKNYIRLRPYHQEYLGNWSKYYTPSLSAFGKTVFRSREEAEAKLKECEN